MAVSVNIKKRFPGFTLDVKFEAGNEILALLGASGCGKSMTLKCIAGIERPDEGRIVLDGEVLFDSEKRINLTPQKRKVGLLFQNYALFPNMTVERNILTGMRRNRAHDLTRVTEILESFCLTGQRGLYPSQLSGGQQQRAALARILAGEPRILMLDEPLSALDGYLRRRLERELREILEQYGGAVIFVTHSMEEVYRLCGKVCVLDSGKAGDVLPVREMLDSPKTLSAARISGCQNFSRAVKISERTVFAQDWNCDIVCAEPVPADVRYIGVRAECISPQGAENTLSCTVSRVIDDISCAVAELSLQSGGDSDFSRLLMELPKNDALQLRAGYALEVGFSAADVLMLE